VAVGIVTRDDGDASVLGRWFFSKADVRDLPEVAMAIQAIVEEHQAPSIALVDRIIGCPHEEGVDYPRGYACPRCPFWAEAIAGRDIHGRRRSESLGRECG
jgi:hypothetical protein